jgi:divalent metal cation (Fe/Co/Zn/Cd) transporter
VDGCEVCTSLGVLVGASVTWESIGWWVGDTVGALVTGALVGFGVIDAGTQFPPDHSHSGRLH